MAWLGKRDRLLRSGREPEIGECDSKRVHDFPLEKSSRRSTIADRSDSSLRASRRVRRHFIANEAVAGRNFRTFQAGWSSRWRTTSRRRGRDCAGRFLLRSRHRPELVFEFAEGHDQPSDSAFVSGNIGNSVRHPIGARYLDQSGVIRTGRLVLQRPQRRPIAPRNRRQTLARLSGMAFHARMDAPLAGRSPGSVSRTRRNRGATGTNRAHVPGNATPILYNLSACVRGRRWP